MEVQYDKDEQKPPKSSFTIFGEPIIKTLCYRNALISAITGGIAGGLVAFLFTSSAKNSTRIGVATYFTIGVVYSCYCAYDEIKMREQTRLLKHIMYQTKQMNESKDGASTDQ